MLLKLLSWTGELGSGSRRVKAAAEESAGLPLGFDAPLLLSLGRV